MNLYFFTLLDPVQKFVNSETLQRQKKVLVFPFLVLETVEGTWGAREFITVT